MAATPADKVKGLKHRTRLVRNVVSRLEQWADKVEDLLADQTLGITAAQRTELLGRYAALLAAGGRAWTGEAGNPAVGMPRDLAAYEPTPDDLAD